MPGGAHKVSAFRSERVGFVHVFAVHKGGLPECRALEAALIRGTAPCGNTMFAFAGGWRRAEVRLTCGPSQT